MASIFDFQDYRLFLMEFFGGKEERRGLKSKAAKFLGCHTTMLSQVLHGQVALSLEQAERLNRYFGHSEEEAHYFLLLVQKGRAGTQALAAYFQKQIDNVLKNRKILKKRVGKVDGIRGEDEFKYYRSWHSAAVHVSLSLSTCNTPEAISRHLGIPLTKVRTILGFLEESGLAKVKDGQYMLGPKHIHLGSDSPHVKTHHQNWRLRAIQALESDSRSDYHYSSAVTLSRADVDKIKEVLIEALKAANKIIQPSKEEEIYALNFDFFNLKQEVSS